MSGSHFIGLCGRRRRDRREIAGCRRTLFTPARARRSKMRGMMNGRDICAPYYFVTRRLLTTLCEVRARGDDIDGLYLLLSSPDAQLDSYDGAHACRDLSMSSRRASLDASRRKESHQASRQSLGHSVPGRARCSRAATDDVLFEMRGDKPRRYFICCARYFVEEAPQRRAS